VNIDGALSIATGSLANINRQMTVISQNVANASTPGYSVEVSTQQSVTADGEGMGVRAGPAIRTIDIAMQAEVFSQNATVSGLQTRQSALQAIDSVLGTPGEGGDLASQLGYLQDQFSTLLNNPANQGAAGPGCFRRHRGCAGDQRPQQCLHVTTPERTRCPRRGGCHAECHAGHDRRHQQQDRCAKGRRAKHGGSGEPA
jgi:hypothetical protein